jgi:hypothetical protein
VRLVCLGARDMWVGDLWTSVLSWDDGHQAAVVGMCTIKGVVVCVWEEVNVRGERGEQKGRERETSEMRERDGRGAREWREKGRACKDVYKLGLLVKG